MDDRRFDSLARSISALGTRRAALRLLSTLPLVVTLAAMFGDASMATAKPRKPSTNKNKLKKPQQPPDDDHGSSGRRRRRKARHKHDPGKDKRNQRVKKKTKGNNTSPRPPKSCVPDSLALTCAGKCAAVANNCGALVECGSCACTPHAWSARPAMTARASANRGPQARRADRAPHARAGWRRPLAPVTGRGSATRASRRSAPSARRVTTAPVSASRVPRVSRAGRLRRATPVWRRHRVPATAPEPVCRACQRRAPSASPARALREAASRWPLAQRADRPLRVCPG